MVFSKNQNTWIKKEFTSGWTFLRIFHQNTVFHVFDQNLIIKYQDETVHGARRWSNFQKCHFLDFRDFTWIHIFHKKCKITAFLAKCKNARKCRNCTKKYCKNTLKISDFGGKPAPKITWRKGAGCTPLVKRQKLTFPEIPCFCGKSQNYHKI